MAQQVTKRYRLLKDLPYTKSGVIYTPENNSPQYYNYNGGEFRNRLSADYVENNPDWFEEVVDDLFKIEWVHFNRSYENGWQFMFQSSHCLTPNKFQEKIKKAIEDIVNGVGNAPNIDQLQREAFEAARQDHPHKCAYKYLDYEDYKKRQK